MSKQASSTKAKLQQAIQSWEKRFDALASREKMIIALVLLAFVVMIFQLVAISPLMLKRDKIQKQQSQLTQDVNALRLERETLNQAIVAGPKRQKQKQVEQLQQEIATLDQQIAATTATMIPPRMMTDVLHEVMQLRKNLRLVQLENLPPVPLLEEIIPAAGAAAGSNVPQKNVAGSQARDSVGSAASKEAVEIGLYRHGVKLVFEGDYLATVEFLQSLEQESWRFFWQALQYDVEKYPKARITLTLYTLSPERAWLGV